MSKDTIEGEILPKNRQRKYEPWMCDKIKEVASEGGHVAAMCLAIGIKSKDTFYRWIKEYPEFEDAYKETVLIAEELIDHTFLMGALGKIKGFNFKSLEIIAKNKLKDAYQWNDKVTTEVNIGSINTLEHMSNEQLEQKIERMNRKYYGITKQEASVPEGGNDDTGT